MDDHQSSSKSHFQFDLIIEINGLTAAIEIRDPTRSYLFQTMVDQQFKFKSKEMPKRVMAAIMEGRPQEKKRAGNENH